MLTERTAIGADVLLVQQLERLVERIREPVERQRVESREPLSVEIEAAVEMRNGANARHVAVVELDELDGLG